MNNIIPRSPHYTNFGTWNRLCYAKFALVELLQTSPQLESVQQRQVLLNAFASFFGDVLPSQLVLNFSYYALN